MNEKEKEHRGSRRQASTRHPLHRLGSFWTGFGGVMRERSSGCQLAPLMGCYEPPSEAYRVLLGFRAPSKRLLDLLSRWMSSQPRAQLKVKAEGQRHRRPVEESVRRKNYPTEPERNLVSCHQPQGSNETRERGEVCSAGVCVSISRGGTPMSGRLERL